VSENLQLINGSWVEAVGGGTWDLVDPSTENVLELVPFGDERDAIAAVEAASAAREEWEALGASARSKILHRAADLIEERADRYGVVTTQESGKPLAQSVAEWKSAPSYLRFAADEATRIGGRIIASRVPSRRSTSRTAR
jgi:succinate-semialdehyde dehydrogenase/glutarate-semialdehyde dehydrogenase